MSVSPSNCQILFAVSYINREGLKFFKIHNFIDWNVDDCVGSKIRNFHQYSLCTSSEEPLKSGEIQNNLQFISALFTMVNFPFAVSLTI